MTTKQRFACEKELFLAAYQLAPERREAILAQEVGGDRELHRRVRELLAAFDQPDPAALPATSHARPAAQPAVADTINGYRLLKRMADGGMGEVWEAEQDQPVQRRVAIKLIKWGLESGQVGRSSPVGGRPEAATSPSGRGSRGRGEQPAEDRQQCLLAGTVRFGARLA